MAVVQAREYVRHWTEIESNLDSKYSANLTCSGEAWLLWLAERFFSKPDIKDLSSSTWTHYTYSLSSYCLHRSTWVTCVCCGNSTLQIDAIRFDIQWGHSLTTQHWYFQPDYSWCYTMVIYVGNKFSQGDTSTCLWEYKLIFFLVES